MSLPSISLTSKGRTVDSFWDFFWLMIISFFFFGYLLVLFQIIIDLFRDRSVSGGMKALWVVGLVLLPLLTSLLYLIFRGAGMGERQAGAAQSAQKDTEAYIQSVAGKGAASPTDQVTQAKALLDSGTITQEEFEALKAKALA